MRRPELRSLGPGRLGVLGGEDLGRGIVKGSVGLGPALTPGVRAPRPHWAASPSVSLGLSGPQACDFITTTA